MTPELVGALIAVVYGIGTVPRRKTPLFYRILVFAVLVYLMGSVYTLLYRWLWSTAGDFHVGWFGCVGMFFFLFSSYYGAIDRLADGGQPGLRKYRALAGLGASVFFAGAVAWLCLSGQGWWKLLVLIPMSFTLFFALKMLILPDVEMGIIRVMRPYNGLIVVLCISVLLRLLAGEGSALGQTGSFCTGILLAVCLPVARNGVRKWFI